MSHTKLQLAAAGLLALASGASFAQTLGSNTCTGFVASAREGVHGASDPSVDGVFWPPNHKLRTITISAENSSGQACNVTIVDARQDEAVNSPGSGNTSPDAANCTNAGNESSIDLRGERAGLGDGRFYHVMYTMDDPNAPGQPKTAEARLLVPHDQGVVNVGTYVDEGPLFPSYSTATLQCTN